MDTPKAKVLLKKIQNLFDAITEAPGEPSKIESDLLRDYTRQFYECLHSVYSSNGSAHKVAALVQGPKAENELPSSTASTTSSSSNVATQAVASSPVAAISPPTPEPIAVKEAAVEDKPLTAVIEEKVEHTKVQIDNRKTTRTTVVTGDASILFSAEEARELSDKLRLRRIDDLSRSMGINERFLTINELFGGNHEEFDRVLRDLNSLGSFDEARHYLEANIINNYGWLDENKQKKAGVFIQLVRRRFIDN